ncbi:hypothetical protein CDAR_242891 [Caerostris darwini]|uniref:Uncharacterized protein n=1 Tax=Caerostris darwini TaxID=1538125 RepID=A0AAV4WAR3_9ARAC|nr:hypothetical protein CDAR_242891 [Caerostris darwini]
MTTGSSSRDGPSIKHSKGSKGSSILRMSGEPDGGITHSEEVVCLANIWEWASNLWSSPLQRRFQRRVEENTEN